MNAYHAYVYISFTYLCVFYDHAGGYCVSPPLDGLFF